MATFPASNKITGETPSSIEPGWPQKAAQKFAGYVSHAAARGEDSQQAVMRFWLKRDGVAPLEDLVRASGVAKSHDFAGVSSSLTRNMLKAGGPKKWYQEHRESALMVSSPDLIPDCHSVSYFRGVSRSGVLALCAAGEANLCQMTRKAATIGTER